jgi:hypothetical protein
MRAQFGASRYPWGKYLDRDTYDKQHNVRPVPYSRDRRYAARLALY